MDIVYDTDFVIFFKDTAQITTADSCLVCKFRKGNLVIFIIFYVLKYLVHMCILHCTKLTEHFCYNLNEPVIAYLTELAKKRQKDLKYSTTTVGPHRDDISFIVNGIDIRKYGSQGQQRTAALSLKLAQIQLMREVMKESPILLLDDVLSELDSNRKTYLLESIKDTQTIITCTGLDEFISKHLPIQRMFQIKAGKIVKEN